MAVVAKPTHPGTAPAAVKQQKQTKHEPKLEDMAATAALYVTHAERATRQGERDTLEEGHHLSAASAATSLKYAQPQDLPFFPTIGVADSRASAGTAAHLANANQKDFEHWKPSPSASASAAAVLAKDYRSPNTWQPEQTSYGHKAALLAAQEGRNIQPWKPKTSEYGNSAAAQATRSKSHRSPPTQQADNLQTRNGSMKAAHDAVIASRKRADSTPAYQSTYPDAENSSMNALNAAHFAVKPGPRKNASSAVAQSPSLDAARIHNIARSNVSRDMYSSHPPVAIEVEEKRRQDTLRAAAISMAKQMYTVQQKTVREAEAARRNDGQVAASSAHSRRDSVTSLDSSASHPMQFTNLEEAAKKLAAERLAKLHDEHAAYREYYGQKQSPSSRLSIRGRQRTRASSEPQVQDDETRSRQIRSQMNSFNQKIAEVDSKKRQQDRDALMAAAQRNVQKQLHGIDEKVFAETGKVGPSMLDAWELKARAAAEAESKTRMENFGKVDIGGGKFLDQADVDAVAARNVQPVLDEINEKVEKQHAKEVDQRLDAELEKRRATDEKAREREAKADAKKARETEKQEERRRKEEEKAKKAEEKRLAKEEKSRSKKPLETFDPVVIPDVTHHDSPHLRTGATESAATARPVERTSTAPLEQSAGTDDQPAEAANVNDKSPAVAQRSTDENATSPVSPISPASPGSGRAPLAINWLKEKIARRASKKEKDPKRAPGFIGGAALDPAPEVDTNTEMGTQQRIAEGPLTEPVVVKSSTPDLHRDSSMRDVALAGTTRSKEDASSSSNIEIDPAYIHHDPGNDADDDDNEQRPSRSRRRAAFPGRPAPSISPVSTTTSSALPPAAAADPSPDTVSDYAPARFSKLAEAIDAAGDDDDDDEDGVQEDYEEARDRFEQGFVSPLTPAPALKAVTPEQGQAQAQGRNRLRKENRGGGVRGEEGGEGSERGSKFMEDL